MLFEQRLSRLKTEGAFLHQLLLVKLSDRMHVEVGFSTGENHQCLP